MKPIEQVFEGNYYDYGSLLGSFDYENILQADVGDWQGDTLVLFKDGDRYGFLTFGWGSCSGCDALQACNHLKDVEELRQQLFDQIVWKDSKEEMRDFLANRDWEAQWYGGYEGTKKFVAEALGALK